MNKLQRFLWWCAGAHIEILEKYPTEWGKYFGIGGTIIFTALMASFAGGYAFFTAFKDITLACAFGIFWGALIFNLDRYIVSSIGKGDGTTKITREEFQNALPRIIMAIMIGFVVSTPLELKVFEREIEVEIQEIINEKRQSMLSGLGDLRAEQQRLRERIEELKQQETEAGEDIKGNDPRIEVIQGEINTLKTEIANLQKQLDRNNEKRRAISTEMVSLESKPGTNTQLVQKEKQLKTLEDAANGLSQNISNRNQSVQAKKNSIAKILEELSTNYGSIKERNDDNIMQLNIQINALDTVYKNKSRSFKDQSEKYNGFMARLEALDRLSVTVDTIYGMVPGPVVADSLGAVKPTMNKYQVVGIDEEYSVVWYAKWMIALLLIAIEIAPILFKMMTESGPYDDRIEEIKYASDIEKKIFISNLNQKTNIELKISNQINEQKLASEMKANQELLQKIAESQSEIIHTAIEQWKNTELQKAQNDPSHFIKTNTPTNHET